MAVGDFVIAFASNHFVCVIDFKPSPPTIYKLPKGFALSCCGDCAETIPERNAVIDIDSHEIYTVSVSFKSPELLSRIVDRASLTAFAVLAQRLFDPVHIADIFHLLKVRGDSRSVLDFVHAFFSQLPQPNRSFALSSRRRSAIPPNYLELVHDMDVEWPSSTRVSRMRFFREQLMQQRSTSEDACAFALRMLKEQNNTILVLRTALTEWANRYQPDRFSFAIVKFVLHTEAMDVECPQIPLIVSETQGTKDVPISREIRYRIRECGMFQQRNGAEATEAAWWNAKIGKLEEPAEEATPMASFEGIRRRASFDPLERLFVDVSEPPSLVADVE
jgi:hypothetical protein